jgi:hypothetical protein
MIGVGCIYEWRHDGVIESDDGVAAIFHPKTLQMLYVPLFNIRATLEYAVDEIVGKVSNNYQFYKLLSFL